MPFDLAKVPSQNNAQGLGDWHNKGHICEQFENRAAC